MSNWIRDEVHEQYTIWVHGTGRGPMWKCLPPNLEPNSDDPGFQYKSEAIAEWVYYTFQHPLCGQTCWNRNADGYYGPPCFKTSD